MVDVATLLGGMGLTGPASVGMAQYLSKRFLDHRLTKDLKDYEEILSKRLADHKAELDERVNAAKAENDARLKTDVEESA